MDSIDVPVVCTASIDYSAVNDYVRAHYNKDHYFEEDHVEHQIFDGRKLQSKYSSAKENILDNGLAILTSSLGEEEIDWSQLEHIQMHYIPELEKIIHDLFSPSQILNHYFWNPMVRGEEYQISREKTRSNTPTASIARLVHIDTDIGAFDMSDLLDIIEKNKILNSPTFPRPGIQKHSVETMAEVIDYILHKKKRFVILNFWRNISDSPVSTAPLAILSTKYDNHDTLPKTLVPCFPNVSPNMKDSKWYIFPNATKDEVIVFYQYDRNASQPSDLFHCAISVPNTNGYRTIKTLRRSFDLRALIILDETVPDELDRYSTDRTRPVLTFEESGCFCDDQAVKRQGNIQ